MAIEPGQQLLHYRLIDKIGAGGMGVVWKAEDTNLDREVAIKFLPDVFSADPERMARFEREAKTLAGEAAQENADPDPSRHGRLACAPVAVLANGRGTARGPASLPADDLRGWRSRPDRVSERGGRRRRCLVRPLCPRWRVLAKP